jgi:hypothetical protein
LRGPGEAPPTRRGRKNRPRIPHLRRAAAQLAARRRDRRATPSVPGGRGTRADIRRPTHGHGRARPRACTPGGLGCGVRNASANEAGLGCLGELASGAVAWSRSCHVAATASDATRAVRAVGLPVGSARKCSLVRAASASGAVGWQQWRTTSASCGTVARTWLRMDKHSARAATRLHTARRFGAVPVRAARPSAALPRATRPGESAAQFRGRSAPARHAAARVRHRRRMARRMTRPPQGARVPRARRAHSRASDPSRSARVRRPRPAHHAQRRSAHVRRPHGRA